MDNKNLIRFSDKTQTRFMESEILGYSLNANSSQSYGYTIVLYTKHYPINLQYSNNSKSEKKDYFTDQALLFNIFEKEAIEKEESKKK